MSGGGFRVSIPSSVRKTIQNIKEIAGNHSDDEIYAMLKECSMDPNETTQKLLLQDTFHEVKRKRDRRKESVNNRESMETRWRTGTQGRGSRGGRANFSPRNPSNDATSGKNPGPGKENGLQGWEKGIAPSQTSHETKDKERSSVTSSASVVSNGTTTIASGSTSVANVSAISVGCDPEWGSTSVGTDNLSTTLNPGDVNKNPITVSVDDNLYEQPEQSSSSGAALPMLASTSTVYFSSSDPVLMPSNDSRVPGVVGAIKREVGHRLSCEGNANLHGDKKSTAASEISISSAQVKMASKSQGVGKGQLTEFSQPSSTSTHVGSSNSRPSSNYSNRSQQGNGTLKAGGTNKEWKPKAVQGSGAAGASESLTSVVEANANSQPVSNILDSEDATSKLEKMLEEKLEELHLQQRQHVILPNHIHVPDSERTKLSFGSFGFSFGVSTINAIGSEGDKSSTPLPGTSQCAQENVEEKSPSNQNVTATADEGDYPEHPPSPTHVPENLSSSEGDVSSNATLGPNESKQDTELPSGGQQYSAVNTSSSYSFGLVPPILGSQLAPVENAESQARDVSHLPSFVVQHFDPTSYYAQFYRSDADTDGRLSPFPSPGVAAKYNGNVAVLPPPNPQSPQEGGVLSTAGPSPLVTQAAGLMQSSIAVTQQPVPVFRPPAGMHISHYPPNYFPYGHYFPPFYVPPPAIHQFLGNGTFPQQPQAGGVYPAPPAAAATGIKYSVPQYKLGSNTGNPAHIGMTSGYGPYGSSPGGYNPNSVTTAGNLTTNDDLGPSQFKENNVYIPGQQSEGSAMWVAAPGRDVSSLPTSSFYSLPPQGQQVAFTPAQAGHGTFPGIYHPAQAVTATVHPLLQQSQTMAGAVDMAGPGGSVYQQPQHTQINWPSNY